MPTMGHNSEGIEVVLLEMFVLPGTTETCIADISFHVKLCLHTNAIYDGFYCCKGDNFQMIFFPSKHKIRNASLS